MRGTAGQRWEPARGLEPRGKPGRGARVSRGPQSHAVEPVYGAGGRLIPVWAATVYPGTWDA